MVAITWLRPCQLDGHCRGRSCQMPLPNRHSLTSDCAVSPDKTINRRSFVLSRPAYERTERRSVARDSPREQQLCGVAGSHRVSEGLSGGSDSRSKSPTLGATRSLSGPRSERRRQPKAVEVLRRHQKARQACAACRHLRSPFTSQSHPSVGSVSLACCCTLSCFSDCVLRPDWLCVEPPTGCHQPSDICPDCLCAVSTDNKATLLLCLSFEGFSFKNLHK